MSDPWTTTRKPTTLRDEPRTLRERVGVWLARRIITEYQHELCAWIRRADAGWDTAVAAQDELKRHRISWWMGKTVAQDAEQENA